MPIKPESITKQQAERFAEIMDADFGRFLNDYQAIPVQKFANALIEAGIVSPPVWAIRNQMTGELNGCYLVDDIQLVSGATRYLDDDCKYEHWKGQAE